MDKFVSKKMADSSWPVSDLQLHHDFLLELSDVTVEMLNETDTDKLLQNIADRLLRLSGGCLSYLALENESGEYLDLKYTASTIGETPIDKIWPQSGLGGVAWSENRVVHTTDYANYERRLPTRKSFKQGCAIPFESGSTMGVLCIFYMDDSVDVDSQIDLLKKFARIAAVALANAHAHEEQRTELSMLETMLEINQAIDVSNEIYSIMQSVCERIVMGFNANRARVYSYSEGQFQALAGKILNDDCVFADTLPNQEILTKSANMWTLENLKSAHVKTNVDDEREAPEVHKLRRDTRIGCSYIVPLIVRSSAWGVLSVHKATGQPDFNSLEKRMIDLLASQLSVAINRQRLLQDIKYQADHDQLTGCVSRSCFEKILNQQVQSALGSGQEFALLYIDLDGFKNINDTMGHDTGDRVLVHVAKLIKQAKSKDMCVARLGGDEFAVLTPLGFNSAQCMQLGRNIVEQLSHKEEYGGSITSVGASVGIAHFPQHAQDSAKLLTCADIAMFHAKASGRARVCEYDPVCAAKYTRKLSMKARVEKALDNGEFELHYQPKVDAKSRKVVGAETLIRWNEPEFSLISPAEWIPIAEETGAIHGIGRWVLENSINYLLELREQGMDLNLSINISATQFEAADFPQDALEHIRSTGIALSSIEFEITESALIKDIDVAMSKLRKIKAEGIRIAIDDFGVQYSSLAYLVDMPVDVLKIDREFVLRMDGSNERCMLKHILVLAQSLGLETVVEGVETRCQLERVTELGSDIIQGFYYSRPVPASELPAVIKSINHGNMGKPLAA